MTKPVKMASATVQTFVFISGAFLFLAGTAFADTPANCSYSDLLGSWTFYVGKGGNDNTVDCTSLGPVQKKTHIKLAYPYTATDEYGNKGFWTLIYNQGFEVVIHGRKYFAFSKYKGTGANATSYCDQTLPGWSHDVLGHDWACFDGRKDSKLSPQTYSSPYLPRFAAQRRFKANPDFIKQINAVQKSWRAVHYPEHEGMTLETIIKRAGGRKSVILGKPGPAPVTEKTRQQAASLPDSFDWRNVNGANYVSPVRNQGGCGSCYAFASMAMNEARLRIETNNTVTTVFSPQDIVECSEYSQGCDGGFPYLIGGKYAEDFGLVEESCNPYKGEDHACSTQKSCKRHYSVHYRYVGGYYGGCNEEVMRISLVKNGPMAVAFEVYNDFFNYQGGIYHHTNLQDTVNPFQLTNHAVTLVGYGEENGVKFWTVKNSWGENWGENGYFRIRRGTDECAIESIAVESFIIF